MVSFHATQEKPAVTHTDAVAKQVPAAANITVIRAKLVAPMIAGAQKLGTHVVVRISARRTSSAAAMGEYLLI